MSLIPTTIITGFLGVGKTTAIRHLLRYKPEGEAWSVLVNEFGEIGIDGALLQISGIQVREVPGGCICCAAGLPMKVALNMLIASTKPDRILIEPTGLGHPAEIIRILTGDYYGQVLDLRATLALVDPRKLADPRYTGNQTFTDQLAAADVLIANKSDTCSERDWQNFDALLAASNPAKLGSERVEQGAIALSWLYLKASVRSDTAAPDVSRRSLLETRASVPPVMVIPEGQDFVRKEGQGQGFYSCGWVFMAERVFDFSGLFHLMSGLSFARAKAIMKTTEGLFSFSAEGSVLSVNPLDQAQDSRIEFLDPEPIAAEQLEQQLLDLRVDC